MPFTSIDWNNPGFARLYGMAFAVSTILTMILWLLAVVKRAVRGMHFAAAMGETIGYLILAVLASGFAPAATAMIVNLVDAMAADMFKPFEKDFAALAAVAVLAMVTLMTTPGPGPMIALTMGSLMLAMIIGLWMMLTVRNALILAGLIFGPTVFAGLVDRDMWGHSKRWIGVMVAVIASKYVIFVTLALAGALLQGERVESGGKLTFSQALATLFTLIMLLGLACFLPFQIAKFVPILGDEMATLHEAAGQLQQRTSQTYSQKKSGRDEHSERQGQDEDDASGAAGGGTESGASDFPGSGGGAGDSGGGGDEAGAASGEPMAAAAQEGKQQVADNKAKAVDSLDSGAAAATGSSPSGGDGPGAGRQHQDDGGGGGPTPPDEAGAPADYAGADT